MKRCLLILVALVAGCATPVSLRSFRRDTGEGVLTTVLWGYYATQPAPASVAEARRLAKASCGGWEADIIAEGVFNTGNVMFFDTLTVHSPNNPFGPGASMMGSTVQERGYYWTFRCRPPPPEGI
jgi:hypothetical protein